MKIAARRSMLAFFAVVLIAITMTSCQEEVDTELEFGKTTTIEEHVELTPVNVFSGGDTVYVPKGGKEKWGYKADKEEVDYVTVSVKVKNLSAETLSLEDIGKIKLSQGKEDYLTWEAVMLEEDETTLQENPKLAAGEEGLIYFLIEADQNTMGAATVTFSFQSGLFDEEAYTLSCDTTRHVSVYTPMEKGKAITAAGSAEIKLKDIKLVERITPTKAISWASYQYLYPAKTEDLLVDVQLSVKNLKKEKCKVHELIGVKAVFNGKTYQGYINVENAENSDLEGLDAVGPGKTRLVHGVIEIPEEQKENQGEIYVYLDGTEYCSVINRK